MKTSTRQNQMSAMEIRLFNLLITCRKGSAFPMSCCQLLRRMMIYPSSSPELLCCMTVHPTSCCVICYSRLTPWQAVGSCYMVWRLTQCRAVWGCCVVWRVTLWAMVAVLYVTVNLPYVELPGIAVLYAGVLFLTTTVHILSLILIKITVCTITTTYRAIICK